MKPWHILVFLLTFSLAACATHKTVQPVVSQAPSVQKQWRTDYEWIVPETDTPVMMVADYQHVLTAEPQEVYTAPPEPKPAVESKPAQPKPKPQVVTIPPAPKKPAPEIPSPVAPTPVPPKPVVKAEPPVQKTPPKPVETAYHRAWRRFCDNGGGMNDEDWDVVLKAKGEVPEEFQEGCLPPK